MNNNEFALKSLKTLMVLPLLPGNKINDGFTEVKQYATVHNINMRRLFNYYERYVICSPLILLFVFMLLYIH